MDDKTQKDFDIWWDREGSGITPKGSQGKMRETLIEDMEAFVRRVSAIAWSNGAFKGALSWTRVKPTDGGLYLLREGPAQTPTMHHLYKQSDGRIQILDESSHYTGDDVQDLHDSYEWFGPIPWDDDHHEC